MRQKTLILMVVAVACGLAASYMTSRLLAERNNNRDDTEVEKVSFLVAKQNLSMGTYVKDPEKYFVIKQVSKGDEPKNALTSFDQVKDCRLNKPLGVEHHITKDDLMNSKESNFDAQLPPGTRAIAIRVDVASLAGGFVLPNSKVDVIGTFDKGGERSTQTILQNVLVLAVGELPDREAERRTILAPTITVAATPEQAQKLTLAQELGPLKLALRKFGDEELSNIKPTTGRDVTKSTQTNASSTTEDDPAGGSALKKSLPDVPPPTPVPEPKETVVPVKSPKTTTLVIYNGEHPTKATYVEKEDGDGTKIEKEQSEPEGARKSKTTPDSKKSTK